MPDIYDKKLSQNEVNHLMAPMELDLIAYFNQLREEILRMIDKGSRNNSTRDELIEEITKMLEG